MKNIKLPQMQELVTEVIDRWDFRWHSISNRSLFLSRSVPLRWKRQVHIIIYDLIIHIFVLLPPQSPVTDASAARWSDTCCLFCHLKPETHVKVFCFVLFHFTLSFLRAWEGISKRNTSKNVCGFGDALHLLTTAASVLQKHGAELFCVSIDQMEI